MKNTRNIVAIFATLVCLLVIGGAGAVAIRPHDCLLLVEKIKRAWMDFRTAQYVEEIRKEKQRELQQLHK